MAAPTPLEIIRKALDDVETDALVTKQHADNMAAEIVAALDAAGYTIKAKPKPRTAKAPEPVEVFAPDTGNPALDDFMRAHHDAGWREKLRKALTKTRPGMVNMPPPPPGHARKPMTQAERAQLWIHHRVQQHSS